VINLRKKLKTVNMVLCIVKYKTFYIFVYLKAIHNKDYSVVKTFKAAFVSNVVFFFLTKMYRYKKY